MKFSGLAWIYKKSPFFLAENICSLNRQVVFEEIFLISLIGRSRWNFPFPRSVTFDGIWRTLLCLNISYLNNFPALHAEQRKNCFFAEDVFSAKIFSDAPLLTKNVVFDEIWGKLICRFWWNLRKSNTSFCNEFCTKLKINKLRIKKNNTLGSLRLNYEMETSELSVFFGVRASQCDRHFFLCEKLQRESFPEAMRKKPCLLF